MDIYFFILEFGIRRFKNGSGFQLLQIVLGPAGLFRIRELLNYLVVYFGGVLAVAFFLIDVCLLYYVVASDEQDSGCRRSG